MSSAHDWYFPWQSGERIQGSIQHNVIRREVRLISLSACLVCSTFMEEVKLQTAEHRDRIRDN